MILDNTGHDNQHRSRGTKAKEDLNEVVYRLAVIDAFTREHTGKVGLIRDATDSADYRAPFTSS